MIRSFVSGVPIPKARPRLSLIRGKVVVFTPHKTKAWEKVVRLSIDSVAPVQPLECAVSVCLSFTLPIPKSRLAGLKDRIARGLGWHVARPDLDNLAKSVLDSMNGVIFKDDSQVAELVLRKRYGAEPGVLIEVDNLMLRG